MATLSALMIFASKTNNDSFKSVGNKYMKMSEESWCKDKYFLGGQLQLNINDIITDEHILFVKNKNASSMSAANSWEMNSMNAYFGEIPIIEDILKHYTAKKRNDGIFRAICFWLSPARKRATEKVFHPNNMTSYFTDVEKELNQDLAKCHI